MHLVDSILNLPVPVIAYWGYLIVFGLVLLESNPFTGFFIPGMMIVVISGFFAKIGTLILWEIICVAILASILGDLGSYLLGRYFGYKLIIKYGKYFFITKEYFDKTKEIMNLHPGKTLVIGRFNSLTRAFSSFVAGVSELNFFRFMCFNIIAGITWSTSLILIGYIFGKSYNVAVAYFENFIIGSFVAIVIFIYFYSFFRKRKNKEYLKH